MPFSMKKNTKQIMWKFKLNILLDLKGSCFWNRYKALKKHWLWKSGIWLLTEWLGVALESAKDITKIYISDAETSHSSTLRQGFSQH